MERIKQWARRASLQAALAASTAVTAVLGVTAYMAVDGWSEELRARLMEPYLEDYEIAPGFMTQIVSRPPQGAAQFWMEYEGTVTLFLTAVIICGVIFGQAWFFYKWKLKKPLEALTRASQKIADSDLDFVLPVYGEDEMGELCRSFETMRNALYENFRTVWRLTEERRRLNAAFSHDLRTPITVLKGYTEMLGSSIRSGMYSKEKMVRIVEVMARQVNRLENYAAEMAELQTLEDTPCRPQLEDFSGLSRELRESARILCEKQGKDLVFLEESEGQDQPCDTEIPKIDGEIVARVFENMAGNAVRFAKKQIRILCSLEQNRKRLRIAVEDDGPGFSREALRRAGEPFFRGESSEVWEGTGSEAQVNKGDGQVNKSEQQENGGGVSHFHFGLGLYICTLLCEKHGGGFSVENKEEGGARSTAWFDCGDLRSSWEKGRDQKRNEKEFEGVDK